MQVARQTQRPLAGASRARSVVVRAAKTANGPRIAVVGVTGAVGQEFLTVRRGEPRRSASRRDAASALARMPRAGDRPGQAAMQAVTPADRVAFISAAAC